MALSSEQEKMLIDKYSTTNPLEQVMQVAKYLPQDQASKILRYSLTSGDAPTTVANNLHVYETDMVDKIDWDSVVKQAPKTAAFLNDPLNMAIARDGDNIRTLSRLEDSWFSFNDLKEGGKGILRALAGFGKGFADFGMELRKSSDAYYKNSLDNMSPEEASFYNNAPGRKLDGFGNKQMGEAAQTVSDVLGDIAEKQLAPETPPKYRYKAQEYTHALLQQSPQYLAQIALAYLTGGTSSAVFIGTQISGDQYLKLRKEGVNPGNAFISSMTDAALQAPLEKVGISKVMKKVPANTSRILKMREAIEAGLTEGITEWLQQ